MKNKIVGWSLPLLTLPMVVFGAPPRPSDSNLGLEPVGPTSVGQVNTILEGIVGWITGLFFVAAILFLFYAAYLYLSAGGEEEKLKSAKNQLIYSIIAIAIALLASSIKGLVANILRGGS